MLVVKVDDMSSIVMSFAMQGHLEMEDGFWNSVPYVNLMCMYILKYIYIFFYVYNIYKHLYTTYTYIHIKWFMIREFDPKKYSLTIQVEDVTSVVTTA